MSRIRLTWNNASTTIAEQRIYRSTAPLDIDDMPEPLAVLPRRDREYLDSTIEDGLVYYYAVSSVLPDYSELLSKEIKVEATPGESDPYWDKVVALLHFDGDFTDESGLGNYTKSATGDVSFSSEGYFEDCVAFGTGTASHVTTDNLSAWDFGNQDFTLEVFLYLTKPLANLESLMGIYSGGNNNSTFIWAYTSAVGLLFDFRAGNTYIAGPRYHGAIPVDEWVHLAVTREGSVFRMFLDGVLVAASTSTATLNYPGTPLKIGGGVNDNVYTSFQGRMDELRVTLGIARYTENFTPPTKPFPNN